MKRMREIRGTGEKMKPEYRKRESRDSPPLSLITPVNKIQKTGIHYIPIHKKKL